MLRFCSPKLNFALTSLGHYVFVYPIVYCLYILNTMNDTWWTELIPTSASQNFHILCLHLVSEIILNQHLPDMYMWYYLTRNWFKALKLWLMVWRVYKQRNILGMNVNKSLTIAQNNGSECFRKFIIFKDFEFQLHHVTSFVLLVQEMHIAAR
jgi:hypothetical protein